MVSTRYAISAYQSAVMTTPPLQAVVLLYDAAVTRVEAAAQAADAGDYGSQFNHAMRAIAILQGLMGSLDLERGGALGARLHDTYDANIRALFNSLGRRRDASACRRIAQGLRQLRNAWAEIASTTPAPTTAPPPMPGTLSVSTMT